MPRPGKAFVLRRPEQVAALGSPVRARIVDVLSSRGPSSVEELATAMGRQPESLYYHVHTLRSVGLLVEHSRRKCRRRMETVYALVAPRLLLDREQRSPAYLKAVADSCAALLRSSARDHRKALLGSDGFRDDLWLRRYAAVLDRRGLRRLQRLLRPIDALMHAPPARRRGETYTLTCILAPLPR
ncbi:MAG TPA: helix-turn-helix domain-containing protein [Phycisphaerae bacterium]|nr:helix-turn-helix domain-containing protein [Phycisphaerae bacterium]HNU43929.1 helix-turn-helix domain-containing protein [Phycisphaerae bacterium]